MSRTPHFPTTREECKTLSLKSLRALGLLHPGVHNTTLNWARNRQDISRLNLTVNLGQDTDPYLQVAYVYGGRDYDYRIALEALPSNLPGMAGRPGRYRLRCPLSGQPATVLYLYRGTFVHRLAYPEDRLYYDAQLTPKWLRRFDKSRTLDHRFLAAREAFNEPGRKTHYQGQHTRWYARFLSLQEQMKSQCRAAAQQEKMGIHRVRKT